MIWGLLATLFLLPSCLSSNDSAITYDDVALTAFTLGTLNRICHTMSSAGEDSAYITTFAGGNYVMSIDQVNGQIYNRDSLPYGTDVAHVVCTLTTTNQAVSYFVSLAKDSLRYYSSTDSIDFRSPRQVRVFSNDGLYFRDYTVTLNVKQNQKTGLAWMRTTQEEYQNHQQVQESYDLKQNGVVLPPTRSGLYALQPAEGILWSTDGGHTWQSEPLDADASLLPKERVAMISCAYPQAGDAEYILLVGANDGDDDGLVAWRKIARYVDGQYSGLWVYMPADIRNAFRLPRSISVSLVSVDDGVLAFGSDGKVYLSNDLGLTWKTNDQYTMPLGINGEVEVSIDDDGIFWLRHNEEFWKGVMMR